MRTRIIRSRLRRQPVKPSTQKPSIQKPLQNLDEQANNKGTVSDHGSLTFSTNLDEQKEELSHFIDLKQNYISRLRILELQEAAQGVDTPAHKVVEINELKKKILQTKSIINTLSEQISYKSNQINAVEAKYRLRIALPGKLSSLTNEQRSAIRYTIAVLTGCAAEQVVIVAEADGSIILSIEMPRSSAIMLGALYQINHPTVATIESIELETIGFEQDWLSSIEDQTTYILSVWNSIFQAQIEEKLLDQDNPEEQEKILHDLYKIQFE